MKHTEGILKGRAGLNLYYQGWLPDGEIRAVLLVAHGIAEHSQRYAKIGQYFADKSYAVYSFDYRGHGKSEGKRGYVEKFAYYLDDLHTFHELIHNLNPEKKMVILGHSMGAIIGLAYATQNQKNVSGLIASGTPMRFVPHLQTVLSVILRPLGTLAPNWGMKKLDSSTLSHDRIIVESYDHDPLIFRGKLTARLIIELMRSIHHLQGRLSEVQIPIFIIHGGEDKLSYPESANIVYKNIGSKDKALRYYPGFYHEILNELECRQVFGDIEDWLSHLA